MFVTTIGIHHVAFRDHYIIGLEPSLLELPETVNDTIDNIFNISEVLVVEPSIVSYYADDEIFHRLQLDVESIPIPNEERCQYLARVFRGVPNVSWVNPNKHFSCNRKRSNRTCLWWHPLKKMKYQIYHGDCLEEMKKLNCGVADLIICDLPYNTTNCNWDSPIDLVELWDRYDCVAKGKTAILLFAQIPFNIILGQSNLKDLRYEWIWEKTTATGHLNANRMPMKAHENIMVFYDSLPTYNPQKTTGHDPVNSYRR